MTKKENLFFGGITLQAAKFLRKKLQHVFSGINLQKAQFSYKKWKDIPLPEKKKLQKRCFEEI